MTRRAKRCPYCERGVKLIDGEHWIVKSIMPARIAIKKCKLAAQKEEANNATD